MTSISGRNLPRKILATTLVFSAVILATLSFEFFAAAFKDEGSWREGSFLGKGHTFKYDKYDDGAFVVKSSVTSFLPILGDLRIIPDDCVISLLVNDQAVDLRTLTESERCDWRNGFVLPWRSYAQFGVNQLEIHLVNKGGPWGYTLKRESDLTAKLIGACAAALLLLAFARRFLSPLTSVIERRPWIAVVLVAATSYATYVHKYWEPSGFFWDENYHVASAEKYLQGVFFMENHPPLGKLLIAAGEGLLRSNGRDPAFAATDYIRAPAEPDMHGYRLFPVLMAWGSCLLFYLIARELLPSTWLALSVTALPIFDNALIVHSRSAMLEGPLLFFGCATAYALLRAKRSLGWRRHWLVAAGALFGAAAAVKVLALILIIPVLALALSTWRRQRTLTGLTRSSLAFGLAALLTHGSVWQVHFLLGETIEPKLSGAGFYGASESLMQLHTEGKAGSFAAFPVYLTESLKFSGRYNAGVPKLNVCKVDENGSPWFFWPLGGKTIDYRREKLGPGLFRYVYLVPNIVGWASGFFGVLIWTALFCSRTFFPARAGGGQRIKGLGMPLVILAVYFAYMVAIALASKARVLYLYHYFVPLVLSFLLFALYLSQRFSSAGKSSPSVALSRLGAVLILCSASGFLLFRPLTYFNEISNIELLAKPSLGLWNLRCVECDNDNPVYRPLVPAK